MGYLTELGNLPPVTQILILAIAHCLIGLVAMGIAVRKGRSQQQWLLWGLIGGTAALIMAILSPRLD